MRQLCRLFKVNRAWYYQRQKRRAEREKEESAIQAAVEKLLVEFNGYGYRRVTKALHRAGWKINHKKVLRLLRKWGLLCRPLRQKKLATTHSDRHAPYAENLLKKHQAEAELAEVNRAWVGDVVMVVTKQERGYLASLLDRYSRRCVGWAVSAVNDTALTLKALNRAIAERQPEGGLIHHSDHGSNYTSGEYQARLNEIGARISHSRPGRPQENGIAESFNKTVSYEKLYVEEYENLEEVETRLGEWLEEKYNARRLHSALGYVPPNEFEESLKAKAPHRGVPCGGLA